MKFTCEKSQLVSAISVASRTVAPKSAIAALEGIHVRAGMDLQLTGYNLETGITVRVDAEIEEHGACIMPARLFFDIVRKMPDDEVSIHVTVAEFHGVRLTIDYTMVNIKTGDVILTGKTRTALLIERANQLF